MRGWVYGTARWKGRRSFLEKRTKKLLRVGVVGVLRGWRGEWAKGVVRRVVVAAPAGPAIDAAFSGGDAALFGRVLQPVRRGPDGSWANRYPESNPGRPGSPGWARGRSRLGDARGAALNAPAGRTAPASIFASLCKNAIFSKN